MGKAKEVVEGGAVKEPEPTWEEKLRAQLIDAGVPPFIQQHKFHPTRKWASDFAWPKRHLIVEVEGATWAGGRHTSGAGFAKDCIKYNSATLMGYKVLRFTSNQIKDGSALVTILQALGMVEYDPFKTFKSAPGRALPDAVVLGNT